MKTLNKPKKNNLTNISKEIIDILPKDKNYHIQANKLDNLKWEIYLIKGEKRILSVASSKKEVCLNIIKSWIKITSDRQFNITAEEIRIEEEDNNYKLILKSGLQYQGNNLQEIYQIMMNSIQKDMPKSPVNSYGNLSPIRMYALEYSMSKGMVLIIQKKGKQEIAYLIPEKTKKFPTEVSTTLLPLNKYKKLNEMLENNYTIQIKKPEDFYQITILKNERIVQEVANVKLMEGLNELEWQCIQTQSRLREILLEGEKK